MKGCQVLFIIVGAPIVAFGLLVAYAKIMIVTGNTSMEAQHAATGPAVLISAIAIVALLLLLVKWNRQDQR